MGCVNVKFQTKKFSKIGQKPYDKPSKPPVLSEVQKNVLRNNWQVLKLHIVNVGVITFVSMFETRPDLKEVFSMFKGKDIQELKSSGLIRAHALRVMATVDKSISRLDEPANFAKFLRELGTQHRQYSVTFNQISSIANPFLYSIKSHIEDHWSDDVEEAWQTLLSMMLYYIREGLEKHISLSKDKSGDSTI